LPAAPIACCAVPTRCRPAWRCAAWTTPDEIAVWGVLEEDERRAVWGALRERALALAAGDANRS
jgi:predicted Fe-S protein YdhL (DUF1289 family)